MDLRAILDHDAVTAPRQQRSQRTFERILAVLNTLLKEKSFDQISMAELADRAGCTTTSIYARFKDKWSMIAALHESVREEAVSRIDRFLAPERWRAASPDEIIPVATAALVGGYSRYRHLLRAVLLSDDPHVYARSASIEQHMAERLAEVLPAPARMEAGLFRQRVRFVVRVAVATLQQRILMHPTIDAELARELAALMISYLGHPPPSRRRRTGA